MNGRALRVCVLALTSASLFVLGVEAAASPVHPQAEPNANLRHVPDRILYRTLFHTVFLLNEKADEAERHGRNEEAIALHSMLKQETGLYGEHALALDQIARDCEQSVQDIDADAREIIKARRAHYPASKLLPGQQPLPPSPELGRLQRNRYATVLHCRDLLQDALGQIEWERFQRLLPARLAQGISYQAAESESIGLDAYPKTETESLASQAQSVITGSTLISYDPFANMVTAVYTTELDFAAQDWYMGRVLGSLTDGNGNVFWSGNTNDTDRDGTVSAIVQRAGQDQMTYSATGRYTAIMDIQDPMSGFYYIDYWNFQQVYRGDQEGTYYFIYMPFYGFGPSRRTTLSSVLLGSTSPATIQAKPRVESAKPTVSPAEIVVDTPVGTQNETAQVSTVVTASSEGLQEGDQVSVEIIVTSGDASKVRFADGKKVISATLDLGGNVTIRHNIVGVDQAGTYTFTTRIVDVRRPDPSGSGTTSLMNPSNPRVTTNDPGMTSGPLTVRP
jgi:hypothetical protein